MRQLELVMRSLLADPIVRHMRCCCGFHCGMSDTPMKGLLSDPLTRSMCCCCGLFLKGVQCLNGSLCKISVKSMCSPVWCSMCDVGHSMCVCLGAACTPRSHYLACAVSWRCIT